jgi:acyl dehydratase
MESRGMRKRRDTGIVRSVWEMFNQNGDKVMQMEGYGMFRRRNPASDSEIALLEQERGTS